MTIPERGQRLDHPGAATVPPPAKTAPLPPQPSRIRLREGRSGYLYIGPNRPAARTHTLTPSVLVDLDSQDRIVGIETIGHLADTETLHLVLERCSIVGIDAEAVSDAG